MSSATLRRWATFPAVLTAGFFVAVLVQAWHHVMWRDEIRTWQVAREATGLVSLWHLMRYEGVPVLWYWIVFVLTRISDNPFLMQFVHVLIATAVVYVVAGWGPFSRVNKVLFALGYYPFFEYAAITRNYALVFLLIVIACAMIARERIRLLALAGVMFLLTQVSIWGAGLGGLLVVAGVVKAWLGPREQRPSVPVIASAVAIVSLGFVLCIVEVLPGPGPSFTDTWKGYPQSHRIFLSLGTIYRAWVPLPRPGEHFWNTNILDPGQEFLAGSLIQAIVASLLLVAVMLMIVRRPVALGWFLVAVVALVGFTYLKFRGSARHDGTLFMVLIATMWLAHTGPAWQPIRADLARMLMRLEAMRGRFLGMLLGLSAIAGVACAAAGLVMPFSATRAIAEHIQKNFDKDTVIAAYTDYGASPISTWLDRPFYSIAMHRDVYYNSQDDRERDPLSMLSGEYILDNVYQLVHERNAPVLLLLNSGVHIQHSEPLIGYRTAPNVPPRFLVVTDIVDPAFEKSIVKDEAHKLYLVRLP